MAGSPSGAYRLFAESPKVIYQKAVETEERYRQYHEEDNESSVVRSSRSAAAEARVSKAKKTSVSVRNDDREEEDISESEAASVVQSKTRSGVGTLRSTPRSKTSKSSRHRIPASVKEDDPRDAQIRDLQAQLDELTSHVPRRPDSKYRGAVRRHHFDYDDENDYRSDVSNKPPIPALPRRQMRSGGYDYYPRNQWSTRSGGRRRGAGY
jgi:hypothetical protein